MDYFSSLDISATGLAVEKLRLEAVALNLANASATAPPGSTPYQPLRVVSRAIGASDFRGHLERAGTTLPHGVVSTGLQAAAVEPRRVHDPRHPDADAEGFVNRANVDPLTEMVTMMNAVRAYEANIKAIGAAKAMAQSALEIGR